jgi:UDP-glucose 4-epimerase
LVDVIEGDITSQPLLETTLERFGITHIIHLAAMLSVHVEENPVRGLDVNSSSTYRLFAAAQEHNVSRVVWASSAAVYGRRKAYEQLTGRTGPYSEDDAPCPRDMYSVSKLFNEVLSRQFLARGLDVVGLRPVTTFGPRPQTGAVGELLEAIRRSASGGTGVVSRYWTADAHINPIYSVDCASQFIEVCLRPQAMKLPVYNTGTGEYATIGDMMRIASELTGLPIEFRDAQRELEPFDCVDCDSTALRQELGWNPQYDLSAALEDCVGAFAGAKA